MGGDEAMRGERRVEENGVRWAAKISLAPSRRT